MIWIKKTAHSLPFISNEMNRDVRLCLCKDSKNRWELRISRQQILEKTACQGSCLWSTLHIPNCVACSSEKRGICNSQEYYILFLSRCVGVESTLGKQGISCVFVMRNIWMDSTDPNYQPHLSSSQTTSWQCSIPIVGLVRIERTWSFGMQDFGNVLDQC